jgi:hypothetical protein
MPVSDDQRALLKLLVEGSNYDGISEVLGITPSEVRARARQAALDLEQDGSDDELAGAARRRLGELDGTESGAPPVPQGRSRGSRRMGPAAWILIGGAVAAVVIVLIVISGSGGSHESTGSSQQSAQEDVVTINFAPVGGSHAHGTARIVRVADRPAVDLEFAGLAPSRPGETYIVSLDDSTTGKALPVAHRDVGPDGRLTGRTEIADAASGLLPGFDTMVVSLVRDREAAASVQAAAQNATLPNQIGTPVLRGELPRNGS